MEIVGVLHTIKDEETINETFAKKEVIVATVEQYSNHYAVEFHNNNINMLDGFEAGQNVRIHTNVRGKLTEKDGNTRAFTTIVGWKIAKY